MRRAAHPSIRQPRRSERLEVNRSWVFEQRPVRSQRRLCVTSSHSISAARWRPPDSRHPTRASSSRLRSSRSTATGRRTSRCRWRRPRGGHRATSRPRSPRRSRPIHPRTCNASRSPDRASSTSTWRRNGSTRCSGSSSRPAAVTGTAPRSPGVGSTWSSSRPTRPAPCTPAAVAGSPSVTRWRTSSRRKGPRCTGSTT